MQSEFYKKNSIALRKLNELQIFVIYKIPIDTALLLNTYGMLYVLFLQIYRITVLFVFTYSKFSSIF